MSSNTALQQHGEKKVKVSNKKSDTTTQYELHQSEKLKLTHKTSSNIQNYTIFQISYHPCTWWKSKKNIKNQEN